MADHKKLIPFILRWEGGWSNDPVDKGGETMKGVTIATYRTYCARKGRPVPSGDDLRRITEQEWSEIFKSMYWDRWRADEIANQSVANILVDWVWASGVHGIKIPQSLLGVSVDGVVGPKTLAALNGVDERAIFDRIRDARLAFVDGIVARDPSQSRFLKGWKNRINDLVFTL